MKDLTGGTDIVAWWEEQRLIYSVNFYTNVIKFQSILQCSCYSVFEDEGTPLDAACRVIHSRPPPPYPQSIYGQVAVHCY